MALRGGLHKLLCKIMESYEVWRWDTFAFDRTTCEDEIKAEAARHVFFQPPENLKIAYPCIIYTQTGRNVKYAGNSIYASKTQYNITVIDKTPDSTIPKFVEQLPLCKYDRRFVTDNLYHDIFTIYY